MQSIPFAQKSYAAAHVLKPLGGSAALRRRPALKEHTKRMKHWKVAPARDISKFEGVQCGTPAVAAHQFEQGRVRLSHPMRTNMACARDPRLHAVDERNRSIEFAEGP